MDSTDGLLEEMEYEGHGNDTSLQVSGYVQGLAQEISQQLECWMDSSSLTEGMLEPMIELLKQIFVDFEHHYVQSLQVQELADEKDELHHLLKTTKEKYRSTVERHNKYVDNLEQEYREEKSALHKLRERNADLEVRLASAKSALSDVEENYEQAKGKYKEESRKLYNAVEFYRSSSERSNEMQSMMTKTTSTLESLPANLSRVAHRLGGEIQIGVSTISKLAQGSVSSPGSDATTPESRPASLVLSSHRTSASSQLESAVEPLGKEIERAQQESQEPSQEPPLSVDPPVTAQSFEEDQRTATKGDRVSFEDEMPPVDTLERSGMITSSWAEVEQLEDDPGTNRHPLITDKPQDTSVLSLAQEFELLAPEEFAQTEMQHILEERDNAVEEKEIMEAEKKKIISDLNSFRSQNMELKKIIAECKAKEETLSRELARLNDQIMQDALQDDSMGGTMVVLTKKEMFAKIKELIQVKSRVHFLEEDSKNLRKLLNERKTPKQKSLLSSILSKVFGRSTNQDPSTKQSQTPTQPKTLKASSPSFTSLVPIFEGISLDSFTTCNSWLVGCEAASVLRSLPIYIGRIPLKNLEISRVDCSAVARIGLTANALSPDRTSRMIRSHSPGFYTPNMPAQCLAEVWVATSYESVSHIEVVSIFSPPEEQVYKRFITLCQHILCMMAIPGNVVVSEDYRKRSRSSLSPPPVRDPSDSRDSLGVASPDSQLRSTSSPDPLGATSPDGFSPPEEDLLMWIISDKQSLHLFKIGDDASHRELNRIDLKAESLCIEYAGNRVFIGQSNRRLLIFEKSANGYWKLDKPHHIGISGDLETEQMNDIVCVKKINSQLWIAIGQTIYVMDPENLGIEVCKEEKPRMIIDQDKSKLPGIRIGDIVAVKNLAIVSYFRRPILKVYESSTGAFIKEINITSGCVVLDKLPTSPTTPSLNVAISTLAADSSTVYVGTRCGKMIAFAAKTLAGQPVDDDSTDSGGDSPDGGDRIDGHKKRKKLKKLAQAEEKQREEAKSEYERQQISNINSSALSLFSHKVSMRNIICLSLPTLAPSDLPNVYSSLVVSIGKGHHQFLKAATNASLRPLSPDDWLSDHCQLLVWGSSKEKLDVFS